MPKNKNSVSNKPTLIVAQQVQNALEVYKEKETPTQGDVDAFWTTVNAYLETIRDPSEKIKSIENIIAYLETEMPTIETTEQGEVKGKRNQHHEKGQVIFSDQTDQQKNSIVFHNNSQVEFSSLTQQKSTLILKKNTTYICSKGDEDHSAKFKDVLEKLVNQTYNIQDFEHFLQNLEESNTLTKANQAALLSAINQQLTEGPTNLKQKHRYENSGTLLSRSIEVDGLKNKTINETYKKENPKRRRILQQFAESRDISRILAKYANEVEANTVNPFKCTYVQPTADNDMERATLNVPEKSNALAQLRFMQNSAGVRLFNRFLIRHEKTVPDSYALQLMKTPLHFWTSKEKTNAYQLVDKMSKFMSSGYAKTNTQEPNTDSALSIQDFINQLTTRQKKIDSSWGIFKDRKLSTQKAQALSLLMARIESIFPDELDPDKTKIFLNDTNNQYVKEVLDCIETWKKEKAHEEIDGKLVSNSELMGEHRFSKDMDKESLTKTEELFLKVKSSPTIEDESEKRFDMK